MTDPTTNWTVPRERLEAVTDELAPPAPATPPNPGSPSPNSNGHYTSRLAVDRWLAARGVGFRRKAEPDGRGRAVYVLTECPFDPAHGDPDSCVMQAPDGKLSAHCFHNSCRGKGWKEFKAQIGPPDPDHYDPPLPPRARIRKPAAGAQSPPPAGPPGAGGEVVRIDLRNLPVRQTMADITRVLSAAGDCYRRADQLVRVAGAVITPVLAAPELAGLLNRHAEVLVAAGDGAEYRPLPTAYANTWLNHPGEAARLPAIALFTLNPVYTPDWRVSPPGYDPATGIYYAGEAVGPREGTDHLDRLLADFCFRTPGDRTNYLGVLLTAVLMPHFIGSKPALLLAGNQPGLGKSVLAQIIAALRDGRPAGTATYNPNDEEFEKRLGAIVRRGATTIVIDNAKARGPKHPRIDSPCLERSITDPVLSFRLLGYSKEIRAENSHLFCLTANTPEVSPDLVTRSVLVALFHEGDPRRRQFTIADPEEYARLHRTEILGELLGLVEGWRAAGSPPAVTATRFNKKGWGATVGGILQVAGEPDFLANADAAAAELDETRREFAALVAALAGLPAAGRTSADLAAVAAANGLLRGDLDGCTPRAAATRIGLIAGRFLGEQFPLPDGQIGILRRGEGRKGNVYTIEVQVASKA